MALLLWLAFGAACTTVGFLLASERIDEARTAALADMPNDDDPIDYWPEPVELDWVLWAREVHTPRVRLLRRLVNR